jgi:predicted glutamine amidotransferase
MHNGDIGNFRRIRRRLLESVCDEAFNNVFGSTDSEHFFAVVIDEILKNSATDAMAMANALNRAIQRVVRIVDESGDGEPSYLNIAFGDRKHAVISRYTNATDYEPESLYWYTGGLYQTCGEGAPSEKEIIVSSERLTREHAWQPVPRNHMVIIEQGKTPVIRPCSDG